MPTATIPLEWQSATEAAPMTPTEADRRYCRDTIRQGSKSFHAASQLLPYSVREPAYALYAFCRLADDAVDDPGPEGAAAALDGVRERLHLAAAGTPRDASMDRVLAETLERYAIPTDIPEALLEGLEWDVHGRRYGSIEDLHGYCARVASTVGVMMTLVMGERAAPVLARACDLGVAMQLTNIARDVGEDAAEGRVYLPLEWLEEAGIDAAEFLRAPAHDKALAAVVVRLLDAAETLYARCEPGIACLPGYCRGGVMAARRIYAEIGRVIEANDHDSVSRRAVVGGRRKLMLAVRSALAWLPDAASASAVAEHEPLAAVRFLVDAVQPLDRFALPPTRQFAATARADRVVDLMLRLKSRDGQTLHRA